MVGIQNTNEGGSSTDKLPKLEIPDEQVYKVHVLGPQGSTIAILVFSAGEEVPVVFSGITIAPIVFSELQIHLDDSIRVIKKKILFELWESKNRLPKCSYEELYLFSKTKAKRITNIHLGNEFAEGGIVVNPYEWYPERELPENAQNIFENRLLLNYPPIFDNEIYVCLAENVCYYFREADPSKDTSPSIFRTYFPLLSDKSVFRLDDLYTQKSALAKDVQLLLTPEIERLYKTVKLFYDVYNYTKRDTPYIYRGIRSVYFQIQPETKTAIPLDSIFKQIHCSRQIPFIKYNPGNRRENLFRLYCQRVSKNGKRIPLLSHKQILKLARETGKSNQISLFVRTGHRYVVYIHFEKNGDVSVQCQLPKPMTESELDQFLGESLNAVFEEMNAVLRRSNYRLPVFVSLAKTRVVSMKYVAAVHIERDVHIEKIDCIYGLLTVNRVRDSTDPIIRYKRVENYREMDAETTLISEMYRASKYTELSALDIVDAIKDRFGKTEEEARQRLVDYLSRKEGDVVDHPGFPMRIDIEKLENVLVFEFDRIDSIRYLYPIQVYVESIIQMTQNISVRSALGKHVRQTCSHSRKLADADRSHVENVISTKETIRPAALALQPFALTSTDTETDFFRELGLADTPAVQDEFMDETEINKLDILEEDLGKTEDYTEVEIDQLFSELRKKPDAIVVPTVEPIPTETKDSTPPEKGILQTISETILPTTITTTLFSPAVSKSETPTPEEKGVFYEDSPTETPTPEENTPASDESEEEQGVFYESDSEDEDDDDYAGKRPKPNGRESNGGESNGGESNGGESNGRESNGGEPSEDARIRPDGLTLNHPNPFLKRLQTREPSLFLSKPEGKKYTSYSTACQPTSRQPVILTNAEKERIDRQHPGSYKHAIQYGTDPKNPHWYICPRYWCFLTNSSISEADVKAGKCGAIIPENADVIPEGAYVYEFKGKEHVDTKGNYIQHYPGFLKEGKHPKGYCLPCCFKNWESQAKRRQQCSQAPTENETVPNPETVKTPTAVVRPPKSQLYIISLDTYPVAPTRWGFLPVSLQLFLNIDYRESVDKNNSALILPNKPTFLRYGVEHTDNQSFLGVFADIYAYKQRRPTIPSIAEFKQILATQITLDVFVRSHNASLAAVFAPSTIRPNLDTSKYTGTEFAKRLNLSNTNESDFLRHTVAAYESFIAYLSDPAGVIDHQYLWDIFTADIAGLNAGGLNLILLEIRDNDIRDKIELICPANSYSNYLYDSKRDSVFVVKHDGFYEPIYLFEFVQSGIRTQKTFSEKTIHSNIKQLLRNIAITTGRMCAPLPSLPKVYEFQEPSRMTAIIDQVKQLAGYEVVAQVVNYREKTVGLVVRGPTGEVMVPCLPIAGDSNPDIPTRSIDDETVWTDYVSTRDRLTELYKASNSRIPCLPRVKIEEDESVVGVLTLSNQFVQLMPPLTEDIDDGIPKEDTANPLVVDKTLATNALGDQTRMDTVARIRLEKQFFLAFRTTVKQLLNDYTNRAVRERIQTIIESPTELYNDKLARLETELKTLVGASVIFVDIDMNVLMELNEVAGCDPFAKESTAYCIVKENGAPQLSIPKTNLLSTLSDAGKHTDNEEMYFARLADELLRYTRVRLFMFEPDKYFNMIDTEYSVDDHEMIISQSTLESSYMTDLEPLSDSNYVLRTTYDTADPSVSQTYANDPITVDEQYAFQKETLPISGTKEDLETECIDSVVEIVGNARSLWKRSFPATAKEVVFKNTEACTFSIMVEIFRQHSGVVHSVQKLKEMLWAGYSRLLTDSNNDVFVKIVAILKRQGKSRLMEPVATHRMTLETRIHSEDYYLSDLDIWVLAQTHQLPVILFNPNGLKGFAKDIYWIKCSGNPRSKYFFIRSTIDSTVNKISQYHLVRPALALSETREFYAIVSSSIQGNAEYARNIHTIEQTLGRIELIPKLK